MTKIYWASEITGTQILKKMKMPEQMQKKHILTKGHEGTSIEGGREAPTSSEYSRPAKC